MYIDQVLSYCVFDFISVIFAGRFPLDFHMKNHVYTVFLHCFICNLSIFLVCHYPPITVGTFGFVGGAIIASAVFLVASNNDNNDNNSLD